MSRKKLILANWKMNGTKASVYELVKGLLGKLNLLELTKSHDIALCPGTIFIPMVVDLLSGSGIAVGAQNVSEYASGAYTGEIAASSLQEFGCTHVIVGHSERRTLFAETNKQIAEKCLLAQAHQMTPVLCIGETLEQRKKNVTQDVISQQLEAAFERLGMEGILRMVIAYEPIWAIGTGMAATPNQVQQMHHWIRAKLAKFDSPIAQQVRILYGGSVNSGNVTDLFKQPDVDGALVGGASLKVEEFVAICQAAFY